VLPIKILENKQEILLSYIYNISFGILSSTTIPLFIVMFIYNNRYAMYEKPTKIKVIINK